MRRPLKKCQLPKFTHKKILYTPKDVAVVLGVSMRTAQNMMDDCRIKGSMRGEVTPDSRTVAHRHLFKQYPIEMQARVLGLSEYEKSYEPQE